MAKYYAHCPSTAYRRKHPAAKAKITQSPLPPNSNYGHAFGGYSTKKKAIEVAMFQGYKV